MKWLEVIKVRTLYETKNILSYLMAFKGNLGEIRDLKSMEIYTDLATYKDITIQLAWENEKTLPYGSESGQQIVSDLRRYGLVDHTTWLRIKMPGVRCQDN